METQLTTNQDLNFETVWLMFKETDRMFKEMREESKTNERLFKEMREESKETDRKLSKIGRLVGNMGRNTGAYAEEYFYHRLKNHNQLLNIKFSLIDRDVKRENGTLDGQYDLVLHNGQYLFVVEIKYKLHPNDVIKFKEKALPKFKKLFPEYNDKKLYIVLAGMVVIPDCKQLCEDYGFLLLTQAGKDITILNEPEFKPQVY